MKYPISTYKILAFPENGVNANDCIDWAYEMLLAGIETPNLLMLAGVEKPASYYDVELYYIDTLKELGLKQLTGDDALISMMYYYVYKIANGEDVLSNLTHLGQHLMGNYQDFCSDFKLLYWALGDFNYGESFTVYWDGVTLSNIEAVTTRVANNWLNEYQHIVDGFVP